MIVGWWIFIKRAERELFTYPQLEYSIENSKVQTILFKADIICLNETKTCVMFNLPGCFTYLSSDSVSQRGGCAVLVKNSLRESTASIDCTKSCLISFKLKPYRDILFVS